MHHTVLIEFCNELDKRGLYKDAEIIDSCLVRFAQNNRRKKKKKKFIPNYRNIALMLTPIVATMLMAHLKQKNIPIDNISPEPTSSKTTPIEQPKLPPLPRGDFDGFVGFLANIEGGLSNRKKQFDPGGLTNLGITQKVYDTYRSEKKLPAQSVKNITVEEKDEIVKMKYWNPIKGDYLPRAIALVLADWRFNGGKPVSAVQRLLKLPVTGKMDKETVNKIWEYTQNNPEREKELAQKLISARQKYLESLKTTVNKKRVPLINYNRGWYNRLNEIKNEAFNPDKKD